MRVNKQSKAFKEKRKHKRLKKNSRIVVNKVAHTKASRETFFFEIGQTMSRSPPHKDKVRDFIGKQSLSFVAIFWLETPL